MDNKKTLSLNLAKIVAHSGLNNSGFEKKLGWSNGYLDKSLKSGNISSDKLFTLFHIFPEINIDWFFTGEGQMFKKDLPDQQFSTSDVIPGNKLNELLRSLAKESPSTLEVIAEIKSEVIVLLTEILTQKDKIIELYETQNKNT